MNGALGKPKADAVTVAGAVYIVRVNHKWERKPWQKRVNSGRRVEDTVLYYKNFALCSGLEHPDSPKIILKVLLWPNRRRGHSENHGGWQSSTIFSQSEI